MKIETLDPWAASSLLQKAVRRGDVPLALQAADRFHRLRGNAIWRRLLIVAYEDIGIGDPDIVAAATLLCCSPAERNAVGSDRAVIHRIVTTLAQAPKNRETDYLICAVARHPAFEHFREAAGSMKMAERIATALDPTQHPVMRAAAAWYASGVNGGGPKILTHGALPQLLDAHEAAGLSRFHLAMVEEAALRIREPIVVMIPTLLALLQDARQPARAKPQTLPPAAYIGEVPTWAFDKHTMLGKRAIARFAQTCTPVREAIGEHVPEFRAITVAEMAAFYADAIPLDRKLVWQESEQMEQMGLEADMHKAGCPKDGIVPILDAVRANLPALNAARASLLDHRRQSPADPAEGSK